MTDAPKLIHETSSRSSQVLFVLLLVAVVGVTFSVAVSSIAMGSAILLFLIELIRSRGATFPSTPFDLLFVLYALGELIATIFSVEPLNSFIYMKRLFLIAIVYLTVQTLNNQVRVELSLKILIGIGAILSVAEILSVSSVGGHIPRIALFQYFLTEGGLKMMLLLLLIPFLVHPDTPRRLKIASIICSVLLFIGLILTQTRSSWLGFIGGVITIGLMRSKKVILVMIIVVMIVLIIAPQDYRIRAASIFDPTMKSNLTRVHMITTGWRMFLDHPITGTGDIDLKSLYITYIEPIDNGEGGHLHNNIMMLLVTLGIVGFVPIMFLFGKIAVEEYRIAARSSSHWLYGSIGVGTFAAFIGFQINGLFEWNYGDHEVVLLFWFSIGLALSASRLFQPTEAVNR